MKVFRVFGLIMSAFLIWGCSTDFTLEAAWKDIPVVYAFINVQDTAHYIRVEKAFLEEGGDAREIAQIPDSLYYENALVQIEKKKTGLKYTLTRVDGNLEGYVREDGPFATSPNYLYKINATDINLQGGDEIRFILDRGDGKPMVTAETTVLAPITTNANQPANPINFSTYERSAEVRWYPGAAAQLFDLRWIFHYKEAKTDNPSEFEDKQVTWVIERALERTDNNSYVSVRVVSKQFFQFLNASLPATPNVKIFDHIDIQITGAGQELADFIRVSQANLGITSSSQVPVYSNLSEGRGVFSSRSSILLPDFDLNPMTKDSLRSGIYTKQFNFQ